MNQYIKYPIAKIISWCFHPCEFTISADDFPDSGRMGYPLIDKCRDVYKALDINLYLENGDGPKFIGLLSAADPSAEYHWNLVKSYWYEDCFVRNTQIELMKTALNFSGDQISGMLEAIWLRHKKIGLTVEEKSQLARIWQSTIFDGTKYQFKHPFTTTVDRGWLLSSFGLGNEVLALLAFLAVGYTVLEDQRYKEEYDKVLKENKKLLCCTDICIWFGRYYGAAWYDEHSQMSLYSIGYDVTKSAIFMDAAKQLRDRYKWNPEIQGYYARYITDVSTYISMAREYISTILKAYNLETKGVCVPENLNTKSYFSLRSFKFVKMSPKILLPDNRTSLYLWETKDIEASSGDQNKNATIDFIHLYSFIKD